MQVREEREVTPDHKIQIGRSSWDNGSEQSVRSYYTNENGGFNYAGSAEVSTTDLTAMVEFAVARGHMTEEQIETIQNAITGAMTNA